MRAIKAFALTCGLFLVSLSACGAGPEGSCSIVPAPKVYKDSGRTARLLGADAAAIVIGSQAPEPEHYAAERLQGLIERRFKRRLPIRSEGGAGADLRQAILIGQRATNPWLDKLCAEKHIDLSATSPGHDGFVIEVAEDAGRQVILIGGSDARGVIYGQDAFHDLLRREAGEVVFPVVSVRDWPSIPWRGRPHSMMGQHLAPGAMDAYVRSRINFIDVRDDPRVKATNESPARKASMGFPPGLKMDDAVVKQVVAEAHRRDIFVYGAVASAAKPKQFDDVMKTFTELVALGVDGLWISFDDLGPGEGTDALIPRVLDLGRQHGMTGRRIAFTPPLESYLNIDTPFNRTAAAIPEFSDALWFFTRVPCAEDRKTAQRIGLHLPPAWWHNLVDIQKGFLYNGHIAATLRTDEKPAYLDIQPLSRGWGAPAYERVRDADRCTDTVMLWGLLGGWPEEYELGALGLWAWDPAKHDWARTRRAIYSHVFGPAQAASAQAFDDKLAQLKSFFHLPVRQFTPNKGWPCRLQRTADRPEALKLLDELDAILKTLESAAPAESALEASRLVSVYLEPMRATLTYARKMAQLEYPEYWLNDLEADVFALVAAGQTEEADRTLVGVRAEVSAQVTQVEQALAGLKGIREYAAFWRERVSGVEYWKKLAPKREAAMRARFRQAMEADPAKLFPHIKPPGGDMASLLDRMAQPPAGAPLMEVSFKDWLQTPPRWRGAWGIAPFQSNGRETVAFALPPNAPSEPGDYAEVRAEVPVPPFEGRLLLDAFINDTRLDNVWRNYRFMQLWVNDSMVWEEDIAPSREGREWVSVDVTGRAKPDVPLKLRFRVTDKRAVSSHSTITFLGPIRLRAVGMR